MKLVRVQVEIVGCDDTTKWEEYMPSHEYRALKRIAARSVAESEYQCQPEIRVAVLEGVLEK